MKKASLKRSVVSISMLYLIAIFLQGCQKETSINNLVNVKTDLATIQVSTKIIYHDVAPDITLVANSNSADNYYNVDLNSDGKADFSIHVHNSHFNYLVSKYVSVIGSNMNAVATDTTLPLEMNLNDAISPALHWINNTSLNLQDGRTGIGTVGNWTDANDHYLGLKINSGGNNYYGWIRMDVSFSFYPSFTVKDYAYNSIPNQPILAGQTK